MLYIIAAPIGNTKDISLRSIEAIKSVKYIFAEDTRKTRLSLKDINSMRLASEAHDAQQKEEAKFTQKMYGTPAQSDDISL